MTEKSFSAAVDEWVRATKARTDAVFKTAAEKLAEEILERTPIITGTLAHSFQASGTQIPMARAAVTPGPINLTIQSIPPGEPIVLFFSVAYAARVEYGFVGEDSLGRSFNQQGRGMIRLAVMNWQHIVDEAAREVKAAVSANTANRK